MLHIIMDNERKWAMGLYIALIGLNMLTIYFVMDLFRYDELLDHFTSDGTTKSVHPGNLTWLLFIDGSCNLLFAIAGLLSRLMDTSKN